jgi:hypothetical protein
MQLKLDEKEHSLLINALSIAIAKYRENIEILRIRTIEGQARMISQFDTQAEDSHYLLDKIINLES